ncbi:MAG: hypothetical protein QXG73_02385, partial [Candidatus Micrarchaeaceae archaeon]
MPSINPGIANGAPMLNLSYDIFSPWSYNTPQNSIDTFPIDVGSRLFVNYNGTLESTTPECLINLGVSPLFNICVSGGSGGSGMSNNNNMPQLFGTSEGSTEIKGPLSVAALPNDYIFVLNNASAGNDYTLNVLRLIPHGYYNTSSYQPTVVGSTTSNTAWVNEWNTYWNNVISMQNQSVYLVQSVGLNNITKLVEQENGYSGYTPISIAADYRGDVFITGFTSNYSSGRYETVLAKVTNISTGPEYFANVISPNLPIESEIAVSPTGGIVFLANKTSGYIQTFNGANFTPTGSIDLSYNKYIGGEKVAELNISSYLENGGLYNQSMPWVSNVFSEWGLNQNFEVDNAGYHHPLAIQDINGYLYVLDQWTGGLGVKGPISFNCWWIICGNEKDLGIFFNMLMLRVMNDTGYDVPINPTNFNDMVQQASCTTPANMNNTCTIISQTEANSECSRTPECTAQPVSSCVNTTSTGGSSFICAGTYPAQAPPPERGTVPKPCAPLTPTSIETCNNNFTFAEANALCNESGMRPQCYAQTQNMCYPSGNIYKCVGPAKTAKTFYATSMLNLSGEYPPYGWVLSANVTAAEFSCSINPFSNDYCGSSVRHLVDSPYSETFSIENQPSNYYGGFPPIGPFLTFANRTSGYNGNAYYLANVSTQLGTPPSGHLRFDYSYLMKGTGFSANYNDTIYMLFPNATTRSQNFTEFYPLLATTKLPVENYTKLFGGFSPYSCYLNRTFLTASTKCIDMPNLQYMSRPIFSVTNPFIYLEGIGSPNWILTFGGLLYSSPTSGGSGISANGICSPSEANGISSCSQCNSNTRNCAFCIACALASNTVTATNSLSSSGIFSGPVLPSSIQSSLASSISGYLVVPFTYNVTEDQSWTNFQPEPGTPKAPNCITPANIVPPPTNTIYYSFAIGQPSRSNLLDEPLESGYSYFQYNRGTNYYIPNLSDIGLIIPPQIAFNIENNKMFGNVYVNMSSPQVVDSLQYVANATHVFDYSVNKRVFTIIAQYGGASFGYENISSVTVNQIYGADAYVADTNGNMQNTKAEALYNGYQTLSNIMPFALSYTLLPNMLPTFVSLFDWYKAVTYTNPLILNINTSKVNYEYKSPFGTYQYLSASPFGYNRLIFVFNDRFNNTFYMPVDADIANITTLDMSATPNVSITNANSTTITVTGRAYYNLLYGLKTVPLQNAPIYLYYGKDINYNKTLSANEISLCAYSPNSISTSNCTLANPMWKGLTNNADTIT